MGWQDKFLKITNIDNLVHTLREYVEVRADLLKEEIKDEGIDIAARVAQLGGIFVLVYTALLFISVGLAMVIGHYTKIYYLGFLIMGFIFTVASIVFAKRVSIQVISQQLRKLDKLQNVEKED